MHVECTVSGSKTWQSEHRAVHLSVGAESKARQQGDHQLHLVATAPWPWKRVIPLLVSHESSGPASVASVVSKHSGGPDASVSCQPASAAAAAAAAGSKSPAFTLSSALGSESSAASKQAWLTAVCHSRFCIVPECLDVRQDQEEDPQFLEWLLQRQLLADTTVSCRAAVRLSCNIANTLLPDKLSEVRKMLSALALWGTAECQLLSALLRELVDKGCLGAALLTQLIAWRSARQLDGPFCLIDHGLVPRQPLHGQPWDMLVQQEWLTPSGVPQQGAQGAQGPSSARGDHKGDLVVLQQQQLGSKRAVILPQMDAVIGPLGLLLVHRYRTYAQTLVPIVESKELWSTLLASASSGLDMTRFFCTLAQVADAAAGDDKTSVGAAGATATIRPFVAVSCVDAFTVTAVVTIAASAALSPSKVQVDRIDSAMEDALVACVQPLAAQMFPWLCRILVVEHEFLKLVPIKLLIALDARWIVLAVRGAHRHAAVAQALAQTVPNIKQSARIALMGISAGCAAAKTGGAGTRTMSPTPPNDHHVPQWVSDPFALARHMAHETRFYPAAAPCSATTTAHVDSDVTFCTWSQLASGHLPQDKLNSSSSSNSSSRSNSTSGGGGGGDTSSSAGRPAIRKRSTITFAASRSGPMVRTHHQSMAALSLS